MGTIQYSKEEQEQLKQLPCVEKVTAKMLVFKQSFKREAVSKSKQAVTQDFQHFIRNFQNDLR